MCVRKKDREREKERERESFADASTARLKFPPPRKFSSRDGGPLKTPWGTSLPRFPAGTRQIAVFWRVSRAIIR